MAAYISRKRLLPEISHDSKTGRQWQPGASEKAKLSSWVNKWLVGTIFPPGYHRAKDRFSRFSKTQWNHHWLLGSRLWHHLPAPEAARRSGVASGFVGVCSRGKLVVGLLPLLVGLEAGRGVRSGLLTRSGGLACRVRGFLLDGPGSTLSSFSGGRVSGKEC